MIQIFYAYLFVHDLLVVEYGDVVRQALLRCELPLAQLAGDVSAAVPALVLKQGRTAGATLTAGVAHRVGGTLPLLLGRNFFLPPEVGALDVLQQTGPGGEGLGALPFLTDPAAEKPVSIRQWLKSLWLVVCQQLGRVHL